ncbi:hypothetical protein PINS_up020421 [Pythium insidiosum]|nr:hypothetical protein PINS_up020421 [Pythium insidiosum]
MSVVETAARSKLQSALSSLRAAASAPQLVLSSVTDIAGVLVASEPRPDVLQRLVTTCLAPSPIVHELLQIITSHERHEQIVGCVCRIVEISCRVSRRFQGELGLVRWCRVLHSVRSCHSESPRVLLASLRCQVALLANCELLQLQTTQSFPALVDEMLELVDRFSLSAGGTREREIAPHFDRSCVVVESLRVLNALFSSVRVAASCPAIASRASDGILERLQRCQKICVAAGRDAVRVWLQTVRSQLQTHPRASLQALTASSSGLAALLQHYKDDVDVVSDVCALLSAIFPVPSGPASRVCRDPMPRPQVDAITPAFAIESALMEVLCECFAALGATPTTQRHVVARLDVARVLRQFCAVPSITPLLPSVRDGQDSARAVARAGDSSVCRRCGFEPRGSL